MKSAGAIVREYRSLERGFMPRRSPPRLGGAYSPAPFVAADLSMNDKRPRRRFLAYVLVQIFHGP